MHGLDDPIQMVKGVGPELSKKLSTIGIEKVFDLINYYPKRYDDYSHSSKIIDLKPGAVTVLAEVGDAKGRYVKRGMHITEAVATDDTGSVKLVWFNQPYRAQSLTRKKYYISGEFGLKNQRLVITNPSIELASDFPVNTARILPIYKETKDIKSTQIRRIIREINPSIANVPESLPTWLTKKQELMSKAEALMLIHFPDSGENLQAAKKRLGFEEVFQLTLAALLNKYSILQEQSVEIKFEVNVAKTFVSHLPFKLTDAQRRVIWQIYQDLTKPTPMNRLIEGDVGAGKTVIAAMAAAMAMHNGYQAAFMAPTELLARQHAETLQELMKPLGWDHEVTLLVGSLSTKEKAAAKAIIAGGKARLLVGTQALIQQKVALNNLGLVIIDEQHRFGVEQRKRLQTKAGHMPHVLSMTATPIPRSLALTLYGELDISIVDAKPAGRLPIITEIHSPNSRSQLNGKIHEQIQQGRQMFVVCPLVADSESLAAKSAESVYEELQKSEFKKYKIGLLHGKMASSDKDTIMEKFANHQLDILVATTVIEVGVNVPNATVMVVENAERFGLAQLHQLRGRVGRSIHQGYCYLMLGDSSAPSKRLRALESSNDGFALAEMDLEIRGPGAIYGTMQHGQLDLRVAKLTDTALIAAARQSAQEFIDKKENLLHYKQLYENIKELRKVTNLN